MNRRRFFAMLFAAPIAAFAAITGFRHRHGGEPVLDELNRVTLASLQDWEEDRLTDNFFTQDPLFCRLKDINGMQEGADYSINGFSYLGIDRSRADVHIVSRPVYEFLQQRIPVRVNDTFSCESIHNPFIYGDGANYATRQ